ncbi:MAG TPA: CRTAC1 family protein [Candidatus Solibacter sp.]|nr:CRTAC1 family protein [Candidatus Solibacter sp.]
MKYVALTVVSFVVFVIAVAGGTGVANNHLRATQAAAHPVKLAPVHFIDIARRTGVTMQNFYGGDSHKEFIIETTGNGSVIFDYDNDGWPDIFLPNGSTVEGFPKGKEPTGHLYHNNHDGTFTDVTEKSGLARPGWGQGGCAGDIENNGHLDLLVTYWGQNVLYRNNGDGTFTDITEKAGLKTARDEWNTGCSFLDYDRDGKVDLFISRYVDFTYDSVPRPGQGQWCQWKGLNVMCGPRGLKLPVNALYHNNGDGTFTDVSKKSGITNTSGCYGFTSLTADFDHDGWPDIYVACDSTPSLLYHNNRDGTFTEIAKTAGVAYNEDGTLQGSMGVSADDFTHSGWQDVVKTNFSDDTPTLYLNRGNNLFDDVTQTAGLAKITRLLGWGVQFFDFDNSGWPGILMANGHVYPEVDGKGLGASYREPKVAYYNMRNGQFTDITAQAGEVLNEMHAAHGMALSDLFNNGRVAAIVNNMNEPPSIYYNTAPVGNFISLQLVGTKSNRAALGAAVTLEQGTDKREKEVRSGDGYISQSDLRLHFGLGQASKAEKITIRWPSGLVETLKDLPANQYYVVKEGSGADAKLTHGVSDVSIQAAPGDTKTSGSVANRNQHDR